ncbi:MAG: hypothetical protein BRC24_01840 [Parcubacteria group bacterium SW_4_46_8]|nr:MAG: hypothetical protein BRC24_01840 [Parcubacteria group bacterium SW_4_46_8]
MTVHTLSTIPYEDLLALFKRKYGQEPHFSLATHTLQESLRILTQQKLYSVVATYEKQKLQGHVALFQPQSISGNVGYFGFLEASSSFHLPPLWNTLQDQASQWRFSGMWGPMNATPWHQYRTLTYTDCSPFFQTEPFSDIEYGRFLEHRGTPLRFYSAYRTTYAFLVEKTQYAYETWIHTNISLTRTTALTPSTLHMLWNIIQETFSSQKGFIPLSLEGFQQLYFPSLFNSSLYALYILKDGERPIGYLSSFWKDNSTLLIKTIALIPSYQGQGLGNVLTYAVHKDALSDNISTVLYGLIREGNQIRHFPDDYLTISRKYALFYIFL